MQIHAFPEELPVQLPERIQKINFVLKISYIAENVMRTKINGFEFQEVCSLYL